MLTTEFNIEGNPIASFTELVKEVKPAQVTLVPDAENVLTSNAGWDTITHFSFLKDKVAEFQEAGIRVSIFIDADDLHRIEKAKEIGTDRIELYTESYASGYTKDKETAVEKFVRAANYAHEIGLGINAGHDLSLENLEYFHRQIPFLDEVSIGHALISDALYLGIENTIQMYLNQLR
jgi:pyridoxine 5-phosphate synthase